MKRKELKTFFPPKEVCRDFLWLYKYVGMQEACNLLTGYYGIRKMKVVTDSKKVKKKIGRKRWYACYCPDERKAYFKRSRRRDVLHEMFHHIVEVKKLKMEKNEDRAADSFTKEILSRAK